MLQLWIVECSLRLRMKSHYADFYKQVVTGMFSRYLIIIFSHWTKGRFIREIIQECHRTVHNNIVFTLSRYFEIPPEFQEVDGNARVKVNTSLPPFGQLEPFDAGDKWILTASVEVQNGNDPDHMKSAVSELMGAQEEFKGCFALRPADRHIFETKVKVQPWRKCVISVDMFDMGWWRIDVAWFALAVVHHEWICDTDG